MEYLYFKTHKQFYDWLVDNGLDLDMSTTCSLSRYTVSISGEIYFNNKLVDMLITLNKFLPNNLQLDEKTSTIKGNVSYLLYLKDNKGIKEIIVEPEVLVEEEDSITVEEPEVQVTTIDLEYAESLKEGKSKKEAKDALESYAKEFNIELAKNKKFEDMITDLKDLSSK